MQQSAVPRCAILSVGSTGGIGQRNGATSSRKKIPRIGVLWPNPPAMFDFMRQGLKNFGYVEGQNTDPEFRWAEGELDVRPPNPSGSLTVFVRTHLLRDFAPI